MSIELHTMNLSQLCPDAPMEEIFKYAEEIESQCDNMTLNEQRGRWELVKQANPLTSALNLGRRVFSTKATKAVGSSVDDVAARFLAGPAQKQLSRVNRVGSGAMKPRTLAAEGAPGFAKLQADNSINEAEEFRKSQLERYNKPVPVHQRNFSTALRGLGGYGMTEWARSPSMDNHRLGRLALALGGAAMMGSAAHDFISEKTLNQKLNDRALRRASHAQLLDYKKNILGKEASFSKQIMSTGSAVREAMKSGPRAISTSGKAASGMKKLPSPNSVPSIRPSVK